MFSAPSLTKTEYSSDKVFSGRDVYMAGSRHIAVPGTTDFGVEIYTRLDNRFRIQHYDQNLILPIPTMREPRIAALSAIGKHPFTIELLMIADGNGASFSPYSTELFMREGGQPVYPSTVHITENLVMCSSYSGGIRECKIAGFESKKTEAGKLISLVSRSDVQEDSPGFLPYILLSFDVTTPYPSEKFRLLLGEIITPQGERIRPTIYFSPVVVRFGG